MLFSFRYYKEFFSPASPQHLLPQSLPLPTRVRVETSEDDRSHLGISKFLHRANTIRDPAANLVSIPGANTRIEERFLPSLDTTLERELRTPPRHGFYSAGVTS